MKNRSSFISLLAMALFSLCAWVLPAQIDLELSMTATPLVPEAFKNYTFTLTVLNRGPQTATAVKVDLPLSPGFTYQGGNAYSLSQGDYDIYFERVWNVGTLLPNASATINLNLYSLQNTNLYYYGQLIGAGQTDVDSTPGNGGCPSNPSSCSTQEDDEALILLSNAGACSLTATVQSTNCIDPGNTANPLDDRWEYSLLVQANNAPSSAWATYSQGLNGLTGNYGNARQVGSFLITDGPLEFTIQDQQNAGCQTNITVTPPAPCSNSNCSIEATTTTPICSDSGTPTNPNDDGFQFILVANGVNTASTQYRARLSNNAGTDNFVINYGQDLLISKFIADGPVQILLTDVADSGCSKTLTVNPTAPCSTPSGGAVDLQLSLTSNNNNPPIYTSTTFNLQLQNTGSLAASNVVVEFPAIPELAFVSQLTAAGDFNNWTGLWNIGNMAAGQTVDLQLTLFTLSSSAITLYAQVISQTGADLDSTPGNGQCCSALEDDEAVLTINGGSPSICTLNAISPTVVCDDNGTSNPGDDRFAFSINPSGNNLGSSFQISGGGLSLNGLAYGQTYSSPLLPISAGAFSLTVSDVSGACAQQVAISPPAPCSNGGPLPGVDLDVAIGASQPTFGAWQFLNLTVTVSNTGTEAATGVILSFPLPDGTVFSGGNEYLATQGTYEPYFEEWNIGTLAPGASVGIQFNLFSIQNATPLVAYAQVLQSNENDVDSTPGNGLCCTAVEDDEAAITLTPVLNREESASTVGRPMIRNLFPNPVTDQLTLVIESGSAREENIAIYNSQGQLQLQQAIRLETGVNWQTLLVESLPAGIYFVHLPQSYTRNTPVKFVVMGM